MRLTPRVFLAVALAERIPFIGGDDQNQDCGEIGDEDNLPMLAEIGRAKTRLAPLDQRPARFDRQPSESVYRRRELQRPRAYNRMDQQIRRAGYHQQREQRGLDAVSD